MKCGFLSELIKNLVYIFVTEVDMYSAVKRFLLSATKIGSTTLLLNYIFSTCLLNAAFGDKLKSVSDRVEQESDPKISRTLCNRIEDKQLLTWTRVVEFTDQ